ncbi:MAG: Ankyrin [Verrucomicrobiaceae bacterium]|nr:Ankyrin [Verrucomicrobiaceae bacterium]
MDEKVTIKSSGHFIFLTALLLLVAGFTWAENASEAQWLQLKELQGISSGVSGSSTATYIFFDPNCPYSAKLNKSGLRLPGVDLRQAMWIPVAYIRPSSEGKAAAFLRSGKYEAIIKNYQSFNYATYEGSIAGVTPTAEESLALDKSRVLWSLMSSSPATPMIIYKEKSGAIKVQLGLPNTQIDGLEQSMGVYNQ